MRIACLAILILLVAIPAFAPPPPAQAPLPFSFHLSVMLPGTAEEIFDAATGDISGWWDHTFSQRPKALILEPKVGGHFLELFDDQGNGAQHAEVIYCQ